MVTSNLRIFIPKRCAQASLRWHYPNQVLGRRSHLPLSLYTSSRLLSFELLYLFLRNLSIVSYKLFYYYKLTYNNKSNVYIHLFGLVRRIISCLNILCKNNFENTSYNRLNKEKLCKECKLLELFSYRPPPSHNTYGSSNSA